ncbi:MAG TPA: polysaccharide biosynthesis tyrosine autokinase [Solirubrobacteraceae bacterium]|jgi:capsular exopolysaccharide synthesis family protein|nr:polysaccharide biosynthesis tyrosine autokinase [Solirubrobacteraceae bacterium]
MQFRDFLSILWRRRLVVAVVFAVCVVAAAAYAYSKPKRYESTATIAFTPNPSKGQAFLPSENLSALLSTYAEVAKSSETRKAAEALLGRPVPGSLSTSTGAGSGILQISDTDTSPTGAAEGASAISRAFVRSIEGNGLLVPTIVDPPVASFTPLQPRPPLIISLAAVLGLIAGVLLALVLDNLRHTAEDPAELTELTGLPVIGRFPRERTLARGESQLVWDSPQLALAQEAFRALRANVELLVEERPSAIQITSAGAGHGKSTITANLGIALGQIGIATTIVDADLRNPRQHQIFKLRNDIGLTTALLLPDSDVAAQETAYEGLSVLTSGPIPANAPEMLHVRFRPVLRSLREQGGIVLIDSPPVLPVSDARLIAHDADAVLFVVAANTTQTSAVASAVEKLRFAHANLIGVVLNFAERDRDSDAGYSYGSYTSGRRPGHVPAG